MLKLTKKADYALMAMKHLAEHSTEGSRSAKDVADAYGIPPEALAKILQRLAKAGLLQSQHGTNGGYTLARAAHTISAFEVIQAIDGPVTVTAGPAVDVTVTNPAEAGLAVAAGPDALCVQGYEAGAHRGTFVNDDAPGRDHGLLSLIGEVAAVTGLPQIAAGGIMGPRQVRAVLAAGAVAAQCGTAFLRSPESGAHPAHKAALADPRYTATVVTRAFSGRPARGLVNEFIVDHGNAPPAYPEINNATRPLRAAAAGAGDTERMSLWAGQGYRLATERPAGEIIDRMRG